MLSIRLLYDFTGAQAAPPERLASFVSRESYKQDAPTAQWNMANIPWHYTACSEPHGCNNQEAHHKQHKFKEEYLELLGRFEVDYNPEYLFDWIM